MDLTAAQKRSLQLHGVDATYAGYIWCRFGGVFPTHGASNPSFATPSSIWAACFANGTYSPDACNFEAFAGQVRQY